MDYLRREKCTVFRRKSSENLPQQQSQAHTNRTSTTKGTTKPHLLYQHMRPQDDSSETLEGTHQLTTD
jgi:hypothetical protein